MRYENMEVEKTKIKMMQTGTLTVPKGFYTKLGVYEIKYLYNTETQKVVITLELRGKNGVLNADATNTE
jgi:hypothetical protein